MALRNASDDGQTYAEALPSPGGIAPVKSVESSGRRGPVHRRTGIFRLDDDAFPALFQPEGNGPFRGSVFHGVVQQDRNQLPDGVLVAGVGQLRLNGQFQRVARRLSVVPKGIRRLPCCLTDSEGTHLQG